MRTGWVLNLAVTCICGQKDFQELSWMDFLPSGSLYQTYQNAMSTHTDCPHCFVFGLRFIVCRLPDTPGRQEPGILFWRVRVGRGQSRR